MVGWSKKSVTASQRSYEAGVDSGDYPPMSEREQDEMNTTGERPPPEQRSPEAWGPVRDGFRSASLASGALSAMRRSYPKSPSRRLSTNSTSDPHNLIIEPECSLLGPAALSFEEKCVVVRNVPHNASASDVRALLERLKGAGSSHLTLSQQLNDPGRPRTL